ncbi:MAG: class I SAM-dependent methyltransferase [Candidatus Omnitrophica bacterium]|nr:class I SAM-dependent methyltransferase [Candidatus Omnitrophota bacterium]
MSSILNCPVCDHPFDEGDAKSTAYPQAGTAGFGPMPRSIHFCPECQAGFITTVINQEELDRYYQQGRYWDQSFNRLSIHTHPGQFVLAQSRWDIIKNQMSAGECSILDIGAGQAFLGWIAAKDPSVSVERYCAVESDDNLRASVQKTWSAGAIDAKLSLKESLDHVEGRYDLIVLSHILEHISRPQEFLRQALSFLTGDGLLFIDVPNQDYRFKPDVFPHLLFFDIMSLTRLIQHSGLSVLSINTYGPSITQKLKRPGAMERTLERCVYRFRKILPSAALQGFFSGHFKVNRCQEDGLWLRALARR